MQCNCNAKTEKAMIGMDIRGKKVTKATNLNVAFTFGSEVGLKSTSTFEVQLDGAKKPIKMPVLHSFCPFCGKPATKS